MIGFGIDYNGSMVLNRSDGDALLNGPSEVIAFAKALSTAYMLAAGYFPGHRPFFGDTPNGEVPEPPRYEDDANRCFQYSQHKPPPQTIEECLALYPEDAGEVLAVKNGTAEMRTSPNDPRLFRPSKR